MYRTEPTTRPKRWKKKKKTKKTDRPLRSEVSVTVRRVRGVSQGFRIVGFLPFNRTATFSSPIHLNKRE